MLYGAPCQGYCLVNRARKETEGLEHAVNLHCKDFLNLVIQRFPHALFIVENTDSMTNKIKASLNKLMGLKSLVIDSADFGAAHRRRQFWMNCGPVRALEAHQHRRIPVSKVRSHRTLLQSKLPAVLTRGVPGHPGYSPDQLEACSTIAKGSTQLSGRCAGSLTDAQRTKLIGQLLTCCDSASAGKCGRK